MSAPLGGDAFERCWCTGVLRDEVIAAWHAGQRDVAALRRTLGVCGGCGTCRPEVEALLRALAEAERPSA